jgi:hypothetical protein
MDFYTAGVLILISIPFFVCTIWAIVNAAQRDFGTLGKKVAWMLIAGIPFVGFIPYFAIGMRQGKKMG